MVSLMEFEIESLVTVEVKVRMRIDHIVIGQIEIEVLAILMI